MSALTSPRASPVVNLHSRFNGTRGKHRFVKSPGWKQPPGRGVSVVLVSAGFSDPGYWNTVTSLMTPHVTVDFSPQSLAALAIGGVLVLGHSWESIEASKGWRENKKRSTSNEYLDAVTKTTDESGAASSNAATASNPKSQKKKTTTSYTKTTTQKVLTNDEREAAAVSARADRVLAIAARRARLEMHNLGEGSSMGNQYDTKNKAQSITIEVCTNNQCAKRGGKELLAALQSLAERSEFSGDDGRDGDGNGKKIIEVKRSRCMDACAVACAVKVTGSGTVTRHDRCAGDEVSISHLPHSAD